MADKLCAICFVSHRFIMTVVEELIEYIKTHTSLNDALRKDIEVNIQIWLNKEKKQITDAYNISGMRSVLYDEQQGDGEDYYNELKNEQ